VTVTLRRLLLPCLLALLLACPPTDDDDSSPVDDDDLFGDDDDSVVSDDDDSGQPDDDDSSGADDDDSSSQQPDDDDVVDDDDSAPAPESCEAWPDADALFAVYNGPTAPAGWFSDSYPTNEWPQWGAGCSTSLADTQALAVSTFTTGTPTGATRTETEFYEADVELNGGLHTVHFRQTRCDWFDGTTLAGAPFTDYAELQWLAGYEWYQDNHNISGHKILGGIGYIGSATHMVDVCHVTTVYGDWGLCDEITLRSTNWTISIVDGVVGNTSAEHRTIQGNCN